VPILKVKRPIPINCQVCPFSILTSYAKGMNGVPLYKCGVLRITIPDPKIKPQECNVVDVTLRLVVDDI
jgi:hypothetical protein